MKRILASGIMVLSVPEIIRKKRDGFQLSAEEIEFFIECVVTGRIDDSQTGAMLMAMYLNKLSIGETISLTKSMIGKGATLAFPNYSADVLVDKHSTGGVGDKISLILAPALAACGLKVPMISGRGLGYTGGTLDKLESIPGFQVHLNLGQMNECLENSGCFICGATENIAPADGILYKMRDATSTVEESSLIVASILSKKAAEGIGTLVMDVKFGKGASIPTEAEARKMAGLLVSSPLKQNFYSGTEQEVGEKLNLKVRAVISDMNAPLGKFIGNSLEVVESIMCLRNEVSNSVTELTNLLGGVALLSKGKAKTIQEGKKMIQETLKNATALGCFRKMLACQGVQERHIEALCSGNYWAVLPKAPYVTIIQSPQKGVVVSIDALNIGRACWLMGAGRLKSDSKIDHSVGLILLKTIGDRIEKGESWIEIHHNENLQTEVKNLIHTSLTIEDSDWNFDEKLKAYLL